MSYWQKRTKEAEQRAQDIAATMVKKQKRQYERIYRRLNKEIYELYNQYSTGAEISRTELWNFGRNAQLRELIREEFGSLAKVQDAEMLETLKKVYERTLETELELLTGVKPEFNDLHHMTMEAQIKEVYKGSNYSQRIYKNTNAIASRVQNDIERLLSQGTSPDRLMKQLQIDFNMGYNQAARLVRTESSRVYSKAAAEGFKLAGIEQVEYDASSESCEVCQQHHGKKFELGQEPSLPIHPSCRCFYIPIVKIEKE